MTDEQTKQQALSSICMQWAQTDPKAANDYIKYLPESPERTKIVQQIVSSMAHQDPKAAAALAWVQKLPEGDSRSQAMSQLAAQWAANDPKAALEFAAKNMPAGKE